MEGMADGCGAVVVLVSCDTVATAALIARALVTEHLAACVTRLPGAVSVYRWEGKVEEAEEVLLLVKTSAGRVGALAERILTLHPYKIPEILSLPVSSGHSPYLGWLFAEVAEG
jgi:periplasmic divalent cation tolerance protein